ncbi:MAG: NUDIX hydrolase [Candidatus Micrarchaeota archaeon]
MNPRVGVGVIVVKDGLVLLGKRKSKHGEGYWSFAGGHLEFMEKVEDCAVREVREEAGIEVKNVRLGPFTNDFFPDSHYVTLFVVCDYASGDVKVMEPEKCSEWHWFSWSELPKPLFLPIENLLKQEFTPV